MLAGDRGLRRRLGTALCHLALLALVSVGGCILSDDRCGPHQVEQRGVITICVCEPNAVPDPNGSVCIACDDNEQPSGSQCVCKDGFARATADSPCTQSSIGAACSATQPCAADFPHCEATPDGTGYCTLAGCSSNAVCPAGFSCEPSGATRVCKKLPSGLGVPCTTAADCASYEADYCESFTARSCLLSPCAGGEKLCPSEWGCCDYGALLAGLSICLAPEQLPNGTCPMGGRLVTP
jgi:hypothetical protein